MTDRFFDLDGKVTWKYKAPPGSDLNNGEDYSKDDKPAIVQEHTDLVTAIRTGNRVNWAPITAESTLAAIMGRESAYTGLEVTKDELLKSDMRLGPAEYKMGKLGIKSRNPGSRRAGKTIKVKRGAPGPPRFDSRFKIQDSRFKERALYSR